eukprot:gnl/MRDRNA2_/MRDRNA2_67414_c0_seq3.p1 gnl/MRDRNA2_/MRDRNA2_67414_c0~~gnl/MRDRNA2_/MRDRNA2_67414_c0_seq3.p1  ORF type:complete len:221 (-),score=47.58 gnl/MRDRNA2_/MRDRNA2_67414_c0_seq3:404-1066(-)
MAVGVKMASLTVVALMITKMIATMAARTLAQVLEQQATRPDGHLHKGVRALAQVLHQEAVQPGGHLREGVHALVEVVVQEIVRTDGPVHRGIKAVTQETIQTVSKEAVQENGQLREAVRAGVTEAVRTVASVPSQAAEVAQTQIKAAAKAIVFQPLQFQAGQAVEGTQYKQPERQQTARDGKQTPLAKNAETSVQTTTEAEAVQINAPAFAAPTALWYVR